MRVAHVAVSENHLLDVVLLTQRRQLAFVDNRNAVRIGAAGQLWRVAPAGDLRYLGGGEGDHPVRGVIAIDDVEVVKITPRGAHDDHAGRSMRFGHGCDR